MVTANGDPKDDDSLCSSADAETWLSGTMRMKQRRVMTTSCTMKCMTPTMLRPRFCSLRTPSALRPRNRSRGPGPSCSDHCTPLWTRLLLALSCSFRNTPSRFRSIGRCSQGRACWPRGRTLPDSHQRTMWDRVFPCRYSLSSCRSLHNSRAHSNIQKCLRRFWQSRNMSWRSPRMPRYTTARPLRVTRRRRSSVIADVGREPSGSSSLPLSSDIVRHNAHPATVLAWHHPPSPWHSSDPAFTTMAWKHRRWRRRDDVLRRRPVMYLGR